MRIDNGLKFFNILTFLMQRILNSYDISLFELSKLFKPLFQNILKKISKHLNSLSLHSDISECNFDFNFFFSIRKYIKVSL